MRQRVLVERPGVGLVLSRVSPWERVTARLRFATLDEALASGAEPEHRPALALRARRLMSARMRHRLAHSLRMSVALAQRPLSVPRTSGGPHIAAAADELLALADHLEGPWPVDVRGVALVCVLLTDGAGPLHRNHGASRLVAAARAAAEALAPRTPATA
jgi:hypothetical protein